MSRVILHVDMDAFYAAVEQRDRPALRGKPVIIGADPKGGKGRGIVSTCSYEARKFGIHSAQPISQAFRLCPHGAYLRPEMEKYESVSRRVMSILGDFTDPVEPLGIDEAFLDVTGSHRLFGSGEEIARSIKARIVADQQLTASVGVAANKFVAKVASGPLTVVVENAVAYYAPMYVEPKQATPEEMSFTFDAGENPQSGQTWDLNAEFVIAGYPLIITSVRAVTWEEVQTPDYIDGSQGYDFGYQFAVESDPSVKFSLWMDIMSESPMCGLTNMTSRWFPPDQS